MKEMNKMISKRIVYLYQEREILEYVLKRCPSNITCKVKKNMIDDELSFLHTLVVEICNTPK